MTVVDAWNRARYRLYAPVYDLAARPLEPGRRRAIDRLQIEPGDRVLLVGAGTGRDLDYLPPGVDVAAIDLTPAMVRRTDQRATRLGHDLDARVSDARSIPFENDAFDAVLLHLVLSVIPQPARVVAEVERVLAPGGRVSIYDKFIAAGERPSLLRRAVNPLARVLFADLNRRLEPMLEDTDFELGATDEYLGGLYTVTIARPASPK